MNHYQNTAARRTPGDNRRQIRSMVQTAIFGAIIVIMAIRISILFSDISLWDLQEPRLSTSPLYWRLCFWDQRKERVWDFFSALPALLTTR